VPSDNYTDAPLKYTPSVPVFAPCLRPTTEGMAIAAEVPVIGPLLQDNPGFHLKGLENAFPSCPERVVPNALSKSSQVVTEQVDPPHQPSCLPHREARMGFEEGHLNRYEFGAAHPDKLDAITL